MVEVLRNKPKSLGFDFELQFFIDIILPAVVRPWV